MKTVKINNKSVFLAFAFILFALASYSQNSLDKAKIAKSNFEYSKAVGYYKDYLLSNVADIKVSRELAFCYNMSGDSKNSEEWQRKVISFENYTAQDKLNFANLLRSNGSYNEAIQQYQEYLNLDGSQTAKINKLIASCKLGIKMTASDSAFYMVRNCKTLNSVNSEFGVVLMNDDFIFASDRFIEGKVYSENEICGWTGTPYLKMFISKVKSGDTLLTTLSPLNELNTQFHNGQGIYDPSTQIFYFTRTNLLKTPKTGINNDPTSWFEIGSTTETVNRLEIYYAKYDNGKWGDVKKFEFNNPEYSVGHPALSPDGNILYFSSDMPGGYGASDIYCCEKNADGTWSAPINVGNKINTEGKEVFPFVNNQGVLYFSSDGLSGIGGLDIFYSTGSKNSWTNPLNIGVPVNSSKDDFSICFKNDSDSGYFASNRNNGAGMDDIYSFSPIASKIFIVAGKTYQRMGDETLTELDNVEITIANSGDKGDLKLKSDENAFYSFPAKANRPILVTISKKGFYTKSRSVEIKKADSDTVYVDMVTEKLDTMILAGVSKERFIDNTVGILKNAKVKIETQEDIEQNVFTLIESDENGKFYSYINVDKQYLLTVMKEGYYTQSRKIVTKKISQDTVYVEIVTDMITNTDLSTSTTSQNIGLKDTIGVELTTNKIVIDQPIIVNNIYYDYNRWFIRPDAAIELNKIVTLMNNNPEIKLELSSHTDCRGSHQYNDKLSQKRAYSAVTYIISKGISKNRIVAMGYGERKLVNKCYNNVPCSEAQHQMNRRTEIKVIGIIKN